jgi:hypothetical protein
VRVTNTAEAQKSRLPEAWRCEVVVEWPDARMLWALHAIAPGPALWPLMGPSKDPSQTDSRRALRAPRVPLAKLLKMLAGQVGLRISFVPRL